MGEEFQNTELHVPPKEAHFNLKQANKATVSFPIKIFPNKTSGTGLGSLAQVAKHPAKGRLCRSQRVTGRVRPPHPRASAMDLLCAWGRESIQGAPGQAEGRAPVTPRQTSPLGPWEALAGPLFNPVQFTHSHWVYQKDHPQAVCSP